MRQAGKIRFLLRAWDTRHGFNKWTHRSNTVSKPLTWDWLHCNQNSKQDIHRGNKCAAPVRKTLRELGEPGPGNGNPCHASAHLQGKHHSSRGVTSSDTLHQEFKQLPDSPPTDTADKPGTSSQDHRSKNLFPFLSYFYDQDMNIQEGKNKAKKKKKTEEEKPVAFILDRMCLLLLFSESDLAVVHWKSKGPWPCSELPQPSGWSTNSGHPVPKPGS